MYTRHIYLEQGEDLYYIFICSKNHLTESKTIIIIENYLKKHNKKYSLEYIKTKLAEEKETLLKAVYGYSFTWRTEIDAHKWIKENKSIILYDKILFKDICVNCKNVEV